MRIVLVLVVVLLLASACRPTYFGDAIAYPAGCDELQREPAQCAALVDAAKAQLDVTDTDITAVDLLTDDRCGDDRSILCNRGGGAAYSVRFTLRGGSFHWTTVYCQIDVPKPYC